jgi:hypothetical protein
MATAPPRSASVESSPPACELEARSTAEGSVDCRLAVLVAFGLEASLRPTAWPAPVPERDDPPVPGGLIPAPNGTFVEELSWPPGPTPVRLA